MWRALGWTVNGLLRATILGGLAHANLFPDDPRYRGKAIGKRGMVMVPLSLAVPLAYAVRRRRGSRRPYPVWSDNLHLSIYALDLVGNYLNLYDSYHHFDAIPHSHGTGALTVAVANVFEVPAASAVGYAQVAHVLLEIQEYYSDVWFGLRNVRGTWDMANDLLAGVVGSVKYALLLALWRRRTGWQPERLGERPVAD